MSAGSLVIGGVPASDCQRATPPWLACDMRDTKAGRPGGPETRRSLWPEAKRPKIGLGFFENRNTQERVRGGARGCRAGHHWTSGLGGGGLGLALSSQTVGQPQSPEQRVVHLRVYVYVYVYVYVGVCDVYLCVCVCVCMWGVMCMRMYV